MIGGNRQKTTVCLKLFNLARRELTTSSVDQKEVAKFAAIADQWWDAKGLHRGLHDMNPIRVSFVRSALCNHFSLESRKPRPLQGLQILDVGCGGGLLSEPLARLGGEVTGLDATEENVKVASLHAARDPATASIKYVCSTAEQMVEEGHSFDAVVSLEVIEHVKNPGGFVESLGKLCKPDGAVIISTINRTARSYLLGIALAEYALGLVPRGTHDWSKFVTPQELALLLRRADMKLNRITGIVYHPFLGKWQLADDLSVNYVAYGTKRDFN